jgi:hypothetical protein
LGLMAQGHAMATISNPTLSIPVNSLAMGIYYYYITLSYDNGSSAVLPGRRFYKY